MSEEVVAVEVKDKEGEKERLVEAVKSGGLQEIEESLLFKQCFRSCEAWRYGFSE